MTAASPIARDRAFFTIMAFVATAVVFVGFAPSFFLAMANDQARELEPIYHFHGAVFTLWMVFFIVQNLLIARGELYRRRAQAGDFQAAAGYYRAAAAAGGAMPEIWRGLGLALIKNGEAGAGRAELQEYLRRAPDAEDRAMMVILAGEPK